MKIVVRARQVELSAAQRDQMIRRAQFALSRLSLEIRDVEIVVTDVNGPRGGDDKRCQVRIRGPRLRPIVVEQTGADAVATVSDAVERAGRATLRTLERRRLFASPLSVTS